MKYRTDRYGNKISILGYGCMRFTTKGTKIDLDKAAAEVKAAVDAGVNYFDTAYSYPGNEAAVGEIFRRLGCRDSINIATKLPHYKLKKAGDPEKFFMEELERLQTDHVDYYLMHMLNDADTWERLKGLGIEEWIGQKKASGQIRQIGFSYHGNTDSFIRLLDAYDWDFCQIQYNYIDENSQAGRAGLQYAHSKGLPVIIMEPLRGGRLVDHLPKKVDQLFESTGHSPAEWGLRWLWNQPEVTCVLSGMNASEQVEENIRIASRVKAGAFTEREHAVIAKAAALFNEKIKVGCTGCGYCMPCPQGVDIPGTFASYNLCYTDGLVAGLKSYFMTTAIRKNSSAASRCIGCGACEKRCPQHIEIREELKHARRKLEGPPYKVGALFRKCFLKY